MLQEEITDDIYPYVSINDKENNFMGSCSTYGTRENVTEILKSHSIQEAER